MVICHYIVSKTLETLKGLIFSKRLRPNIGLIDPGPLDTVKQFIIGKHTSTLLRKDVVEVKCITVVKLMASSELYIRPLAWFGKASPGAIRHLSYM